MKTAALLILTLFAGLQLYIRLSVADPGRRMSAAAVWFAGGLRAYRNRCSCPTPFSEGPLR